jgi:hypothetical protein
MEKAWLENELQNSNLHTIYAIGIFSTTRRFLIAETSKTAFVCHGDGFVNVLVYA